MIQVGHYSTSTFTLETSSQYSTFLGIQGVLIDYRSIENYRRALPGLMILEDVQSEEFQKKQLLRQAALILPEVKLRVLKDILARTKNIDEAVQEFRRFKEEPETQVMHDGNGKYLVAKSEDELIQRLHDGWKLVQALNHDKYLLEQA